jgi:cardiolipin synthase
MGHRQRGTMIYRQIPNLLTGLRLFAAPFAALWIVQGHDTAALIVFILAGLSDAADGFLAKRYGLTTRFGAWLDPIADKTLMIVCFLALTYIHESPLWLAALIIARDVCIITCALLILALHLPMRIEAQMAGKASTVGQIVYIALLLILLAFNLDMPQLVTVAALITAAFTLVSWFVYGRLFVRALCAMQKQA